MAWHGVILQEASWVLRYRHVNPLGSPQPLHSHVWELHGPLCRARMLRNPAVEPSNPCPHRVPETHPSTLLRPLVQPTVTDFNRLLHHQPHYQPSLLPQGQELCIYC